LKTDLAKYDSSELVIVRMFASVPSATALQNLDTTSIGGSNNLATNPTSSIYPYNYMAIGVPGPRRVQRMKLMFSRTPGT
jgi:hypothetical protein